MPVVIGHAMPRARRLVAAVVCAICAAGCSGLQTPPAPGGGVCTTLYAYGLAVTVNDAATGQPVCDAQVTAASGAYRETLMAIGSPGTCSYVGAGERPGTYDLSASKAGYIPATLSNVRVDADQCHVIPVRVTLDLKR